MLHVCVVHKKKKKKSTKPRGSDSQKTIGTGCFFVIYNDSFFKRAVDISSWQK